MPKASEIKLHLNNEEFQNNFFTVAIIILGIQAIKNFRYLKGELT